jgi:predicted amidohydrolase YtcJ
MPVVLTLLAAIAFLSGCSSPPAPDVILHSGKIVTVDPGFRIAEAVAIRGDRIVAVGANADIMRLARSGTEQIDLEGKTVLPGLIDTHVHSTSAAVHEFDHEIPDMETIGDVLRYIESRTKAVPEGGWIWVRQVFITRLKEQRYPTRQELDKAAPKHPVVFSTGPDASLNSLALKLSGIDRNFQITDGRPGRIERDPRTGEPTGILRNCSRFIKGQPATRTPSKEDRLQKLKELMADYNRVGLTSIADRNAGDDAVELYRELRDRGEATCRVFLSYAVNAQEPVEEAEARIRQAAKHPLHKYDNMVWLRGIKVFLDGGMLTGSAYMREPWGVSKVYSIDDPAYRGMRYIEHDKLVRLARTALENQLQFTAHSVGDGAVHALIDAYAEINRTLPVRERRPSISHCNFMSLEAVRQMKELGIVADLQPAWLWLDGATLLKQFGNERLSYFQPYKTIFEHGVVVGGGSDHMQKIGGKRSINPYNPFLGMWIALNRVPKGAAEPLHPEQRISREEAIRLYTINNAWLTFEEREKGSLEPGKLADLIVLKQDILTCPLEEVQNIEVERTYLGGKLVYRAD